MGGGEGEAWSCDERGLIRWHPGDLDGIPLGQVETRAVSAVVL